MKFSGICWVVLLTACIGGCGGVSDAPDLVEATGTVLYNDAPVSGANVTFIVEGSPISTASTNAEGKFVMTTGGRPGAPLGNAKVGISKAPPTSVTGGEPTPEDMAKMAAANMGKSVEPPAPEVPLKYGNPAGSGLTATLDKDGAKNVFEFRLVD